MPGTILTTWTIRLALACYLSFLWGSAATNRWHNRPAARWVWTAGCALLLAHVVCAFHFIHGWQHESAVTETARRTAEQIGWEFGGGVYFNYVFAALWLADVSWWWLSAASYRTRPKYVGAAIHTYLFFITFNGAIVFETGPTRWFTAAGLVVWLALGMRRWQRPS